MGHISGLVLEWLVFLARWLHIVAAIAWVGASFYFIWVESALIRGGKQRSESVAGHLWLIHGGGFYYLEKQGVAPMPLPPVLHWFKWEAYVTWLSGALLMILVYYANAVGMLLLPDIALSAIGGVAIGIGFLAGGWAVYVGLCATALLRRPLWFAAVATLLLGFAAWGLLFVFTPRAVFLHVGAMLATVMTGNVLMVIIPAQRRMVAAANTGTTVPASASLIPGLRSLHNNYLALPVVFLMISPHAPLLSSSAAAPLTMILLILFAGCLRHVINLRNKQQGLKYRWCAAAAAFLVLSFWSAYPTVTGVKNSAVTIANVMPLIKTHCVGCHAATPTDPIFRTPPLGLALETPQQVMAVRQLIYRRVVVDKSMPLSNQTGMNDDERQKIADWALGNE